MSDKEKTFYDILRDYQKEAIEAVIKNERGIVELPTGAGKTLVAIGVIKRLLEEKKIDRFIVTVPTISLALQWERELKKHKVRAVFGYDYFGGDSIFVYPTFVKISNRITELMKSTKPILTFLGKNESFVVYDPNRTLLVVDEVHHAHKNKYTGHSTKLYDAIMKLNPRYFVGLSATLNKDEEIYPAKVVFSLTLNELQKYLPKIDVYECFVSLDSFNEGIYNKLTLTIAKIKERIEKIVLRKSELTESDISNIKKLENDWAKAVSNRHTLVSIDDNVLRTTAQLASSLNGKTIIFVLRLLAMDMLSEMITRLTNGSKVVVKTETIEALKDLKNKKWDIAITVRRIAEGVDLPEVDNIILSSYPAQLRSIIQMIGRGLRGSTSKTLNVYFIIASKTYEERAFQNALDFMGIKQTKYCPIPKYSRFL